MSLGWQDAPDASGLWWVRREGQPDDVLRVTRLDEHAVWINGTLCTLDAIRGWRWCRVAHPDRVEALESALRSVIGNEADTTTPWCARCCLEWDDPHHDKDGWCHIGRALAVLRGATVAGERGSRG